MLFKKRFDGKETVLAEGTSWGEKTKSLKLTVTGKSPRHFTLTTGDGTEVFKSVPMPKNRKSRLALAVLATVTDFDNLEIHPE